LFLSSPPRKRGSSSSFEKCGIPVGRRRGNDEISV
jgi:hypothetical protein